MKAIIINTRTINIKNGTIVDVKDDPNDEEIYIFSHENLFGVCAKWFKTRFQLISDEDLQPLSLDQETVKVNQLEEVFP